MMANFNKQHEVTEQSWKEMYDTTALQSISTTNTMKVNNLKNIDNKRKFSKIFRK